VLTPPDAPPRAAAPQEPLLWAWLCHLSLRDVKAYICDIARRELRTENLLVCAAKLALLPAVIVWCSFVEVGGWGALAVVRAFGSGPRGWGLSRPARHVSPV
jgi:hypothetical protein